MAYDAARFSRVYLPTDDSAELGAGWLIASVDTDRVRSAIDVRLEAADGRSLIVFIERRVEGAVCFATTARLSVSYYAQPGVSDAEAAEVTRALVERLRAAEDRAGGEALDGALSVETEAPSRGGVDPEQRRTLELRINRECNEACSFCNTPADSDTILPGPEAILATLLAERAAGYEDVTFTGREPTLDAALPSYLERARALGYRTIRVQTNGTTFAAGPLLERLIGAGMNTAEISLHTLDPGTFSRLVGAPSLLDKTVAGISRLAGDARVQVHLVVVLTKLNASHLSAVLERVADVHPDLAQVTASVMAPVGEGAGRLDLIPRLDELRAPLEEAFAVAHRRGLTLRIPSRCGTPLCAMPPGTEALNDELHNAPGRTLEPGKSKPAACSACRWEPRCTGVWTACLERWGEDVVSPVEG